ncbi:hypothetical protein Anas_07110 [Armadillidium nasatum]|uniref:Uncharacterized protein n=1 Tax=Armadillidium nasatum TaxID=96803 RepID=A0A5N5TMS0_9CRUS|nr:hypothetical protein Anas_07110 [Armadillidium nasatum]
MKRGKVCQDLGNRSFNSQCWQKNKKQLYLVIYEYILEVASYCRISKNVNMKEFMPDEFEILAARLCSQLFNDYEEVTTLEVTQIGATQTQSSSFKLGSKRRKIEIGFSSVCEKLQDNGALNESIPMV